MPRRPPWQLELAVVAFLLLGYDRVAGLADLHVHRAQRSGEQILRFERVLHLDPERRLDQALGLHRHLSQVAALYYDLAHIIVTIAVLVAIYFVAPQAYRRARSALVTINLVALVMFLALPVAPPRLLPGLDYVDVVARSGTWAAWQASSAVAPHANEYASMPSLHVAWALWVALAVASATRRAWLRRLSVAHVLVTVGVVVITGNHYVLDAVAGGVIAAASWYLVPGLARAARTGFVRWPELARSTPDRGRRRAPTASSKCPTPGATAVEHPLRPPIAGTTGRGHEQLPPGQLQGSTPCSH